MASRSCIVLTCLSTFVAAILGVKGAPLFTSSPSEHTASNRKRRRKRRRKNKMIVRIPSRLHQTMGPVATCNPNPCD